jgi:hypothetical protein
MEKISVEIEVPNDDSYEEALGFCIQAMDRNDPTFGLFVSMLSFCREKYGLTDKQIKLISPILAYHMAILQAKGDAK